MSTNPTTEPATAPADAPVRRRRPSEEPEHHWTTLLYAVVWLVFLVFPGIAIVQSDAPTWARVLGFTGLGLFAVLYTVSWARQILRPRWGAGANAALWCVVLVLPLMLLIPTAPWSILYTAPYFVAVCAFRLPLRHAVLAAGLIATAALIPVVFLLPAQMWTWLLVGILPAWLIILPSRLAMDRAELHSQLARELEISQHREAVGRDVHDILGHSLTVITVKTQLAQRLVETDPQRAVAELDDVLALSREALTDVRSTVGKLRELDLGVELAQARAALRAGGTTPHIPSVAPPMDPATRSAFAWILREATTNVMRHAGASHCWVTVTPTSLRIKDDGAWSPPSPSRHGTGSSRPSEAGRQTDAGSEATPISVGQPGSGVPSEREAAAASSAPAAPRTDESDEKVLEGHGIRGMKERAREAGYEVTVTRNPRRGMTVEVTRA